MLSMFRLGDVVCPSLQPCPGLANTINHPRRVTPMRVMVTQAEPPLSRLPLPDFLLRPGHAGAAGKDPASPKLPLRK